MNYMRPKLGGEAKSPCFYYCSTTKNKGNSVEGTTKSNEQDVKDKENSKSNSTEEKPSIRPPEEPTTCCMSGCPNCVWLEYAEKLTEYYKDGGEKSIKEINEKITDPSIKAYLLHEIRIRNKK